MAENSKIEWCGRKLGSMKTAAKRIGVSLSEYKQHLNSGEKWCYRCKAWHKISNFNTDQSRGDGMSARCRINPLKRKRKQPLEQVRAHRLIAMRIRRGKMPNPNDLKCLDCGHLGTDRRHEYDHYLGYAGSNKEKVEPVCSLCHAQRHKDRKNGC